MFSLKCVLRNKLTDDISIFRQCQQAIKRNTSDIFVYASLGTEQEHPVSYCCCIGQGLGCVSERKIGNLGETAERLRDLRPAAWRLSLRSAVTILITFHFLRSSFLSLSLLSHFLFLLKETYKGNIQKQKGVQKHVHPLLQPQQTKNTNA